MPLNDINILNENQIKMVVYSVNNISNSKILGFKFVIPHMMKAWKEPSFFTHYFVFFIKLCISVYKSVYTATTDEDLNSHGLILGAAEFNSPCFNITPFVLSSDGYSQKHA